MLNAGMDIRDANAEDAEEACQVLRRSIIELCAADHRNDPALLEAWLRNKTPANVAAWMKRIDASYLVAVDEGAIAAVGAVTDAGEILLNYVSPDARFRGASRALLAALEARAAGTRRDPLHADQHGNGAAVLSRARLRRDRRAGQKIRDGLRLSHVQGFDAVGGLAAPGDGGVGPDRHGPFLSWRRARSVPNRRHRPARPDDCGRRGRRRVIRAAFAAQSRPTTPPSSALRETSESIAAKIAAGGGFGAFAQGRLVAVALWQIDGDAS